MALPADFNKIFGSTATGGLTPISDVNYAKGWEYVGSNPPTKNDFSYLQNFSDLKSQWLYGNKLQRSNPFGDIALDGSIDTALTNLGIGTAAKLAAATATHTTNTGYLTLPCIRGGLTGSLILQWGEGSANSSGTTSTPTTIPFIIPFPNRCIGLIACDVVYDMTTINWSTNPQAGRCVVDFNSVNNNPKTGFRVLAEGSFDWFAVGY